MSCKYQYAIVQFADRDRGETLNAALAVFTEDGLDLRVPRRLDKLRALSLAIDLDDIRASIQRLEMIDRLLLKQGHKEPKSRIAHLKMLTPFAFSSPLSFEAPSSHAYNDIVLRLMKLLIEPEPAQAKSLPKRTKLVSVMKAALKAEKVLAGPDEGLGDHRVVLNLQVAEGLFADFALKNGAMHIIETVDVANEAISAKKVVSDIAVSALVLEQARMTFGERNTRSRLVYDASPAVERLAIASLEVAAHQGAELVNWASTEDRKRFLSEIYSSATPREDKRQRAQSPIHASVQHKFNLN